MNRIINRSKTLLAVVPMLLIIFGATNVKAAGGAKSYNDHCSRCHGNDGRGGFMPGVPDFTRGEGLRKNNRELIERIQAGKNACPSYRGILTERETLSLVNYLRTFY